jgi:D-alanine-D-alanine ligase
MMKTLPRVAVFMGGMSPEHDISVLSGREVYQHIPRTRWDPFVVHIDRKGSWTFPDGSTPPDREYSLSDGLGELLRRNPSVVFPLLHGAFGEDGRFQGLLDYAELPYVGSGCLASALALNKARARDVMAQAGIQVPHGEEVHRAQDATLPAPCVIKPMHLGSSVGLRIAHTEAERLDALRHAFEHDSSVLVESFVSGREFTAGVLDQINGPPIALPIVEIRPNTSSFFDYHAKYTPGATDEICPAPIPAALRDKLQAAGLAAHSALGCKVMSRTDIIVAEDNEIFVLETNTLPGMTATSLLPQAAAAYGLTFPELIDHMLTTALG